MSIASPILSSVRYTAFSLPLSHRFVIPRPVSVTRRRLLSLFAGLAAAAGVSAFWASRMRNYQGPVSDHFDGTRFFDPDGSPPKTLGQLLRWQFGPDRQRQPWPEWAPSPYADTPPPRVVGDRV